MSMEQRITTLEEVSRLTIEALRAFNESMRRYEAAAARRDEAMRLAAEAMSDLAASLDRQESAIQALMTFAPITQAEIVRLDSRLDSIEEA